MELTSFRERERERGEEKRSVVEGGISREDFKTKEK